MADFQYTATDTAGNEFTGVYTDVESVTVIKHELSRMGYDLVKAQQQKKIIEKRYRKVKLIDIVSFAYEFAGMYSAGLSIPKCLETIESQAENQALKHIVIDIRETVEAGSTLKDAFEKHRSVFSSFFIGMIEAGETGGKLGETLNMAAETLEKQAELRAKIRAAFAYPIVVGVMCIGIVTALIIFVIPVFQKLYRQLNVSLPAPTLALIAISHATRKYWWIILPVAALMVFAIRKLLKNPLVKARTDHIKLNMPYFGKLNRMIVASRFVRTFAMMISAGVNIVEALELAKQVANNTEMEKAVNNIQHEIMTGSSLAEPMARSDIFPPMIIQLTAAGEEAGVLPDMLIKGVGFLDKNIDRAVKALLVKIEPAMSVIMGLIVGGILMGVYLPMFDYMGQVR